MKKPPAITIKFKKDEIWIIDRYGPIAVIPCPNRHQEDAYCYLLASLNHEVEKAAKGAQLYG